MCNHTPLTNVEITYQLTKQNIFQKISYKGDICFVLQPISQQNNWFSVMQLN